MFAVMGALREEMDGLKKLITVEETLIRYGRPIYSGTKGKQEILLVQTGLGRQHAEETTSYIAKYFPLDGIVSIGFGGALAPYLAAGDLVLCAQILRKDRHGVGAVCSSSRDLLALASEALEGGTIPFVSGSCLTANGVVGEPRVKRALGEASGAQLVDMESYWISKTASLFQIPFLAVRAVSDSLLQTLPPFDRFVRPEGDWDWQRAGLHFVSHPGQLGLLPGLLVGSRRAARSLTYLVERLLARLASRLAQAERAGAVPQ